MPTPHDLSTFEIGERVQLHPGTDRWMMGDRMGNIKSIDTKKGVFRVKLDVSGKTLPFHLDNLLKVLGPRDPGPLPDDA